MTKSPFSVLHEELMEMFEDLLPEKVDYSTSQKLYKAFKGVRDCVESLEKRIAKLESESESKDYAVFHVDMVGRLGYPFAKKVTFEQALQVWKDEVVSIISDFYSEEESRQAKNDDLTFNRLWDKVLVDSKEDPDNALPRIIRYDTSLDNGWEIIK